MSDHLMTEHEENELNRFWNDLLQGISDPDGYDLPAEDRNTLTTFHTRGTSIMPGPTRERAWQETLTRIDVNQYQEETSMNSLAISPAEWTGLTSNRRAIVPPSRPVLPVSLKPAKTHLWPLVSIAAAAILLIAAISGYFMFGPGSSGDNQQPVIPAAVFTEATPSPTGPVPELLLEVTLPAEVMPTGDSVGAGFVNYTLPVGTSSTWVPTCCSAPLIEFVVRGTYAVQAEQPIQVIRGDGSVEEVPAGTKVTLLAGDGLISNVSIVVEASNVGTEPVQLLTWVIATGDEGFNGRELPGWREITFDGFGVPNPPAPALVRIQLITLAPDETWTAPPDAIVFHLSEVFNDEGTPVGMMKGTGDNLVVKGSPSKETDAYVLTLEPAEPTAATPTS